MVKIEIDGKELEVEQGSMIIEATDSVGVEVPRFCYHKKLSVAANCRMCLVDVENMPKAVPACATPVTDGMKVNTKSKRARDAQKAVMEFLLINHPLDCPICDQGGECELQDVSMGYGKGISRYTETKRSVDDKNIGPLISTEMTRCIHCTRCVRFGEEIAGVRELGLVGRGEHTEISTYVEQNLNFEMSGNVIDLCPVGALTSKPYRYSARAWELRQNPVVSPHDCAGSNLYSHTLRNEVKRVVPCENDSINETWISDRDRYSYEGLYHSERLIKPQVKVNGSWQVSEWDDILEQVVKSLTRTIGQYGVNSIGALLSSSSTLEEMYLLQKIIRSLGSHNIDYRVTEKDFRDEESFGVYPGFTDFNISEIENFENIVLVGTNLRKENPIINHRVRKAFLNGSKVSTINPIKFDFNFDLFEELIDIENAGDIVTPVIKITKYILEKSEFDLYKLYENLEDYDLDRVLKVFKNVTIDINNNFDKKIINLAESLLEIDNSVILLGRFAMCDEHASLIRAMCHILRCITGNKLGFLTSGANSQGAWISGAIPHRSDTGLDISHTGLNFIQMLEDKSNIKYFFLYNLEPEFDIYNYKKLVKKLNAADKVVVFTPFITEEIKSYADIILPISPFTETSGTYVNVFGEWQSFQGSVKALGESRPGWKVLRVLGNLLNLLDFKYNSTAEIREQLKEKLTLINKKNNRVETFKIDPELFETFVSGKNIDKEKLFLIHDTNIYNTDNIVRRAKSLHETQDALKANFLYLNTDDAKRLQLSSGNTVCVKFDSKDLDDYETNLVIETLDGIPKGCIYSESPNLGHISGYVNLSTI